MARLIKVPKQFGRAWSTTTGWFFLSVNGDFYRFHLSIGPLVVAWERD